MLPVLLLAAAALFPAAQQASPGWTLTIHPPSGYATTNEVAIVEVIVEVTADTEIPASVLHGNEIMIAHDGGNPAPVRKPEEPSATGTVKVAKGTRITRKLPVQLGDKPGTARLSWDGMPAAQAAVYVVADMKDVKTEELDLAKTRVLLFTNFGNMEVSFFPDKAPGHVQNFINLSKSGFYDGTRFHRIIKGFMIQGGDPNTKDDNPGNDGMGTPGYTIDAEFNDTLHDKGILSMARSGDPNSAGSQFFVVHGRAPHLDRQYTAFGKLEKGLEVLDKIVDVPTEPTGERSRPTQDVWLKKALVLGVRKGQ